MHRTYLTPVQRPRKPRGQDLAIVVSLILVALTVIITGFQGFFASASQVHAASLVPTSSTSYPYIVITSPTTGASDGIVNWTIKTSVLDPNSTITQVALYDGTTQVATTTTAPYTFIFSASLGSHTLTAVATDATGATGVSLPVGITCVSFGSPTSLPTPASITWLTPNNGSTFTAPANIPINLYIPPIPPSQNHFNYINKVQYYSGTTLIGTDTNVKQNNISPSSTFVWTNVPAGTYVLVAIALNSSNGGGITSSPITITVNNPTPTSVVTATSPSTTTPTTVVTATPTTGITVTPTPTAKCAISYVITSQWAGGFGASVTITNISTTTINGWSLVWSFANGQTITQIWNANYTASGGAITATNVSYNGTIAPNANLNFGFNGSWSGSNAKPTSFILNGQTCNS